MNAHQTQSIGFLHAISKSLQLLLPRRLRNYPLNDCVGSVFFHGASRFGGSRISHKGARRWIHGTASYASQFQGFAVGPPGVSIESLKINRSIWHNFVEVLLVRKS